MGKSGKIDISRFIEDGANTIIYYPSVCPLKMYVELVEKYPDKYCAGKCGSIEKEGSETEDDNN